MPYVIDEDTCPPNTPCLECEEIDDCIFIHESCHNGSDIN